MILIYYLQAYGIKFIITVDGLAQKFSLKNTVLNVGNGLALLGITTVLCELVLMYFIKVDNTSLHYLIVNIINLQWTATLFIQF